MEVVIPYYINHFDIDKFLYTKYNWIKKNLDKIETIKSKYLFLGNELILEEQFNLFNDVSVLLHNEKFIISKPEYFSLKPREVFNKWLRNQAEIYIPARVNYFADKNGFKFNKISIKDLKTRWGSCSSKRNLSFNYKLMHFDKKVIDYVVVHELCHLKELNHSKKFWELVEEIMPNYKIYKPVVN